MIGKYGQIPEDTTVADITKVQAGFTYQQQGASHTGSLRWDIGTDLGDLHVYYGDSHDWTGTSGTDVNLMDATDDRFDDGNTSVAGGTFYNTRRRSSTSSRASASTTPRSPWTAAPAATRS